MIQQLSIYTENRKGAMNKITKLIAEKGISIYCFITNDSGEFGTVRMIVSEPDEAEKVLSREGYMIKNTTVIAVKISDEAGSLDQLLEQILYANVNINYMYATFNRLGTGPVIIIHADDMAELENFLNSRGYETL